MPYLSFDGALTTFSDLDHFRDVTKMIGRLHSCGLTGGHGTPDGGQKIVPACITQRLLQFTSEPEFDAFIRHLMYQYIESLLELWQ